MTTRFLAILLIAVFVLGGLTTASYADSYIENHLHESHKNVYAGNDFSGLNEFTPLFNPLNLSYDLSDPTADFSFWHLIDSSKESVYADVWFRDENDQLIKWTVGPIKNNQHFAIITPSGWMLADGISYSNAAGNFVLSHSGRHQATAGTVKVVAQASAFYTEITPHEFYERPIDKYYERPIDKYFERSVDEFYERTIDEYFVRTVDEFFERTVDEYYERDVFEFYERDVMEYFQRDGQRYLVPVFEKAVNQVRGTLVTRLNYNAKNNPINGGAFNNGHTYVEVDVAQAMSPEGIWFEIADSSKKTGKKTADEFNIPIGYFYNVRIVDGMLIISFPDDLAYVNVGAYVAVHPKGFPGNAPSHQPGGVTVPLPANAGAKVLLYTHIDGLAWYQLDDQGEYIYRFVEWRRDEERTEIGDYAYLKTVKGDYELVKTEFGEYELVDTVKGEYQSKEIKYGEWQLSRRDYGKYQLVDKIIGEYVLTGTVARELRLVDEVAGEYQLVSSDQTTRRVDVAYSGSFSLSVDDQPQPLNTVFSLPVGSHTFVLSGDGFLPITKIVTIVPGDNGTVMFGPIEVQLPDVTLEVVKHYADVAGEEFVTEVEGEKFYSENINKFYKDQPATRHERDLPKQDHFSDLPAEKHYADREPQTEWADRDPIRIDIEDINYLEDIKLGNETDPYGEYAIRLN